MSLSQAHSPSLGLCEHANQPLGGHVTLLPLSLLETLATFFRMDLRQLKKGYTTTLTFPKPGTNTPATLVVVRKTTVW